MGYCMAGDSYGIALGAKIQAGMAADVMERTGGLGRILGCCSLLSGVAFGEMSDRIVPYVRPPTSSYDVDVLR
jgi:hypothetical protein